MYTHVFVAGTFDGLHAGHRAILARAFREGEKVTIGLTSDLFVEKFKIFNSKFSNKFQISNSLKISNFTLKIKSFSERKKVLVAWLREQGLHERATIIPINDPYEPAASDTTIDSLVVTPETRKRGEEINQMRKIRDLKELAIIEVSLEGATDGKPISSTRIRNGEIDHQGNLVMPEELRPLLVQPLGKVLTGNAIGEAIEATRDGFVVTVGDVTTKTFIDAGRLPDLAIIDLRVGRQDFSEGAELLRRLTGLNLVRIVSGPGYISKEAMGAVQTNLSSDSRNQYIGRYQVVIVEGEEDLLTLPAVVYAPIGSRVYYGQPGKGIVEVVIDSTTKKKATRFLAKFVSV